MKIGPSAGKTKSLAYFIGTYLGDGWMGYVKSNGAWLFRLNTIDLEFAEAARESIKDLTGNTGNICTHPVSKSSKPNNSLGIGIKDLFWVKEACDNKQKIPDIIWDMDDESKLEFIAGVMDSEGYVSIHKRGVGSSSIGIKATEGWILDFYRFCQQFGLKIGKIGKETIKSGKTAYRYSFNRHSWMEKNCYFKIIRKQEKIGILRDYMLNCSKPEQMI